MKHRLFVYGTLKRGMYFHDRYLKNEQSKFVGPALASNDYTLYVGANPHLVREQSDKPVKGELYEIDTDVLLKIDELEAHPVVYKREIIEVSTKEGNKTTAWAYLRHPNFKDKSQCYKEDEYV